MIIPEKFTISREEITAAFHPLEGSTDGETRLDVTVYSFTPGYESIRFSDESSLIQKTHAGTLKLLLKLKKKSVTEEVRFITVEGNNKAEMMAKLEAVVRSMAR